MQITKTFIFALLMSVGPAITMAHAQAIPGSADPGRVDRNIPKPAPVTQNQNLTVPKATQQTSAPEGAEEIRFVLKGINIEGATAFKPSELAALYSQELNKEISLADVYKIADRITALYRDNGYFLSLAYIPDQKINTGIVTIKLIEGHIDTVDFGESLTVVNSGVLSRYAIGLMEKKPVTSKEVESFLLRMNDLPGLSFRAVLSPLTGAEPGKTKMTLIPVDEAGRGSISFDNFGSRFLGPHEMLLSYSKSFLPLQQTSVSILKSLPTKELQYVSIGHSISIAPDLSVELSGSTTRSEPGSTLRPFEIEGKSTSLGIDLKYQWIRQRDHNLFVSAGIDGRNTTSDILGTALTRDYIRALHAELSYDTQEYFGGFSTADIKLRRGISGLGASDAGDLNLSRADAEPDFTKVELTASHLRDVSQDWSILFSSAGQLASKALYSSEEFGYGGQSFGRAFDSSELTGDKGVSASVEVRYRGLKTPDYIAVQPYAFYDIGAVWNLDQGDTGRESGASAGAGLRFATQWNISGSVELAFPLTRSVESPIYEGNSNGPRLSLRVAKEF